MSLPGWALPVAITAIVGFGLFGVYSNLDYSHIDSSAKSTSKPVIPVWVSGDEEPSSAEQSSDTPTPTPVPTLIQSPSSGAAKTPGDPWTSEAMEAASREPSVEESKELDGAVEGDNLLRDAFSDGAGRPEDSVPSEVESPFASPLSEENTTAHSQNSAQPSAVQPTAATPQQASSPPTVAPFPSDIDDDEGGDEPKRILIVEDARALSESLPMVLNREPDLEVVGRTSSAAQCLNFAAGEEGLDVSIVDLFLPDGQGIDLIEELRKSCPHVPVVVLTTSLDLHDHEQLMKAGADAVLGKGADPDEIVSTVRRLSRS